MINATQAATTPPRLHCGMAFAIEIDTIKVLGRLRQTDRSKVDALAKSMARIGLVTPITVRTPRDAKGFAGAPILVAGAHRLEASKQLGWTSISCFIIDGTADEATLWEIDENLCRAELNEAEIARLMARRKEIYLELHPETEAGKSRALGTNRSLGHDVDADSAPTFVDATVSSTGKSKRSIEIAAERGAKIAPDVLDEMAADKKLGRGVEMDAIKDLPHEQQRDAVAAVKAGKAKTVREAVAQKSPKPEAPGSDAPDMAAVLARLAKTYTLGDLQRLHSLLGRHIIERTGVAA